MENSADGETNLTSKQNEIGEVEKIRKEEGNKAANDVLRETKRDDYISWPDYYMAVACLSAQRSKDPHTQVGACIVNQDKKIVGVGYNGMPIGCSDDKLPWRRASTVSPLETKYPYVCHAEMNAIMNKNSADVKGCVLYATLFPCNECAKLIIQAGIKKVVYMRDKPDKPEMKAAKLMFDMCNIEYELFQTSTKRITIEFSGDFEPQCRIELKEMKV